MDRVVAVLRTLLVERFGTDTGIVYGGSAGPGLLPRLASVDDLFLGRLAHDPANLGPSLTRRWLPGRHSALAEMSNHRHLPDAVGAR